MSRIVRERVRFEGALLFDSRPFVLIGSEALVPGVEGIEEPLPFERCYGIVDDRRHRLVRLRGQRGQALTRRVADPDRGAHIQQSTFTRGVE